MLETEIAGIRLKNPTILASGILGVTRSSLLHIAKSGGPGAVTMKSVSREPRKGHKAPIFIANKHYGLNAVGYSNPGLVESKKEFQNLDEFGVPVFASIIGTVADDFAYMAKNYLSDEFSAVEIPLSCPHTPGFGTLAGQGTPEATYDITKAVVKNTKLPVIVKVSPNIAALGDVAKAAEKAGAKAINAVNTLGPGMRIDIRTKQPILDFKIGGVSGPALFPIALRCVYDIYNAVKIPIIGTGGIKTGSDAVEMIMAGAAAVGIGTAVHYRGQDVFNKVSEEIKKFMEKEGYSKVSELVGVANEFKK